MHLQKAQPGSINSHESSWAVFALKSCQAPTLPSPVSLLRQTNRLFSRELSRKGYVVSPLVSPLNLSQVGSERAFFICHRFHSSLTPHLCSCHSILILGQFSPLGVGGGGEWIDGLVSGQEKGKRKEGCNGSKHSYIDLFFRLQKYNFFFNSKI